MQETQTKRKEVKKMSLESLLVLWVLLVFGSILFIGGIASIIEVFRNRRKDWKI